MATSVTNAGGDRPTGIGQVREVFIVHVGGTCCVTSSTDNIMKILARITLTVEFIHVFLYFELMFEYNDEYDQD